MSEDVSAFTNPERNYQCSKGHTWTAPDHTNRTESISFAGDDRNWCVRCILELLAAQAGVVSEAT